MMLSNTTAHICELLQLVMDVNHKKHDVSALVALRKLRPTAAFMFLSI